VTIERERLRWNGWGRLDASYSLSPAREKLLRASLSDRLGRPVVRAAPPVTLEDVRLPPPKLSADVLSALRTACGEDGVRTGIDERLTHAAGKSLPDLLRLRRGEIEHAPEAVVYPGDEGAVGAVLRIASDAHLAVVPFGGGTSVVGGVAPSTAPEQLGALSLDTTRLDALLRIDPDSHTATFQAGIDGPALEAALSHEGFTLGHYPQSFEHSTLGGWIATRSCGQQSDGYGGISRLVVSVRMVTPEGVLRTLEVPDSSSGPDLNQLVLGSEGILGVIVEATLRIRPAPAASDFRGMLFGRFADGVAAIRQIVQEGVPVSMLRLSDAQETDLSLLLRRDPRRRWDPASLLVAGSGRCALLYGAEGSDRGEVRRAMRRARSIGRRHGGLPVGRGPGRAWKRERFRTPYLRDWLLDHSVAVDTVESAFPWSVVERAHDAILRGLRAALETHAEAGLAMAHLSHSYPDGACLYFTVIYPLDPARDVSQWTAIKQDATEAVLEAGGTVSHHHGVGVDHAPWVVREKGALGVEALRAVKQAVDPLGLLNPGKLL
jgi:alkyldihydroxyacetonephosphate synthase